MAIKKYKLGRYVDLKKINHMRTDFKQADLKRINLTEANLTKADISEANLEGAILIRVNFKDANLEGANLTKAILLHANFEGANLKKVNFNGANLEGANIIRANLEDVNFKGTIYENDFPIIINTEYYPIVKCKQYIQVGCYRHTLEQWTSFKIGDFLEMGGEKAMDFWTKYNKLILN